MVEITVVYHEEDGLWWAESDQVPGWAAGGDSREEARDRVREGLPYFLDGEVVIDERFPVAIPRLEVQGAPGLEISAGAGTTTGVTPHVRVHNPPLVMGALMPGAATA